MSPLSPYFVPIRPPFSVCDQHLSKLSVCIAQQTSYRMSENPYQTNAGPSSAIERGVAAPEIFLVSEQKNDFTLH